MVRTYYFLAIASVALLLAVPALADEKDDDWFQSLGNGNDSGAFRLQQRSDSKKEDSGKSGQPQNLGSGSGNNTPFLTRPGPSAGSEAGSPSSQATQGASAATGNQTNGNSSGGTVRPLAESVSGVPEEAGMGEASSQTAQAQSSSNIIVSSPLDGEGEFTPTRPGGGVPASMTPENEEPTVAPSSANSGSSGGGMILMVILGITGNPDTLLEASITPENFKNTIISNLPKTGLPPDILADLTELLNRAEERGILMTRLFILAFLAIVQKLQEEHLGEGTEEEAQLLEPGWFHEYNSCGSTEDPIGIPTSRPGTVSAGFISTRQESEAVVLPSSVRLFDTSETFEFFDREWFPTTDNPNDSTVDYHGLNQWQFFCFGNRAECFPIQATPLQYGCGGVRARIIASPGSAVFDSPGRPDAERRVPGLVR